MIIIVMTTSVFLSELSPVPDILQKENTYAAVVGDFNINLQQINERVKFEKVFWLDVYQ